MIVALPGHTNLRFGLNSVLGPDLAKSISVVECLTRDRTAAGSSLTGVTALCP